jgi:serine/threonine protein phosphatase PrpC
MKHQQLRLITAALLVQNGNKPWIIPTPITVRLSDNDFDVFEIHGLSVSPKRQLFVMGSDGQWNELEATDTRAEKMIDAIHDRIQKAFKQFTDANEEMDIRRDQNEMRFSYSSEELGG